MEPITRVALWISRIVLGGGATLVFTMISLRYVINPVHASSEIGVSLGSALAVTTTRIGLGAFPLGADPFCHRGRSSHEKIESIRSPQELVRCRQSNPVEVFRSCRRRNGFKKVSGRSNRHPCHAAHEIGRHQLSQCAGDSPRHVDGSIHRVR